MKSVEFSVGFSIFGPVGNSNRANQHDDHERPQAELEGAGRGLVGHVGILADGRYGIMRREQCGSIGGFGAR